MTTPSPVILDLSTPTALAAPDVLSTPSSRANSTADTPLSISAHTIATPKLPTTLTIPTIYDAPSKGEIQMLDTSTIAPQAEGACVTLKSDPGLKKLAQDILGPSPLLDSAATQDVQRYKRKREEFEETVNEED
jgi:hypothetical protein